MSEYNRQQQDTPSWEGLMPSLPLFDAFLYPSTNFQSKCSLGPHSWRPKYDQPGRRGQRRQRRHDKQQ